MLFDAHTPFIYVVPNDEVLRTQLTPSTDVASFPDPPAAIHNEADGDYVTARIGVAPKPEDLAVQVTPSTDVASFPELPPATYKLLP